MGKKRLYVHNGDSRFTQTALDKRLVRRGTTHPFTGYDHFRKVKADDLLDLTLGHYDAYDDDEDYYDECPPSPPPLWLLEMQKQREEALQHAMLWWESFVSCSFE